MPKLNGLGAKQALFVQHYLRTFDATNAAIEAGYSPRSAHVTGCRLLTDPKLAAAIKAGAAARVERLELKADDVLRELQRLAFVDVGAAFDEHGNLKPIQEIPPDVRRAIAGIDLGEEKIETNGEVKRVSSTKKVRFHSKTASLEMLGKNLKLWVEQIQVSGAEELMQRLLAGRRRVSGQ